MREQTYPSSADPCQHLYESGTINADWLRAVAGEIRTKWPDPREFARKELRPLLSKWAATLVWNSAVLEYASKKKLDPAKAHLHLDIDPSTSSEYRNGKRIPMLDKFAAIVAFATRTNISDKVVPHRNEIVWFAVQKATTELRTMYFQPHYSGLDLTRAELDLLYTVLTCNDSARLLGAISRKSREVLYRYWLEQHFKRPLKTDITDIGRLGDVIADWGLPFALLHLGLDSELNYNVAL